jgi:tetratricopeptide (TPR) repeat protein
MSAQEVLDFFRDNKDAIAGIVSVLGLVGGLFAFLYREAIKEWWARKRSPARDDRAPLLASASQSGSAVALSQSSAGAVVGRDVGAGATVIGTQVQLPPDLLARYEQAVGERALLQQEVDQLKKDLASAREDLERQAEAAREPEEQAQFREALAHLNRGDTARAEDIFTDIAKVESARGTAHNERAAVAYRHLGALAVLHDTQKALAAYRRATELTPEDAEVWNALGLLQRRLGEIDPAAQSYAKVIALGEEHGRRDWVAAASGNLGNLYATRGELERAEEMYKKSLAINEALGRKEGMANAYGNLGLLYATRGEPKRAEEMYRKSLEINEALGRKEGMANQYGNLGNLYFRRGELERAEEMYKKSLAIEEALGRKEGMASDYGNLGLLYQTRGELERAEEMLRKSLEMNEALGRKEGMAIAYGNLGLLYATRGELERAEEMYRKSLEMNEALGRKEGMANQYGNLGLLYQTRGELERAEAMYRKALVLFRDIGMPHMVRWAEERLAELAARRME